MKKRYSKIFFGIIAVFAGIALAVYAFVPTFTLGEFSIWKLALGIGLIYWLFHNIFNGETVAKKLDVFLPIGLLLIVFKSNLEAALEHEDLFDSWLIILAAIILTIAVKMLFGHKKCSNVNYGTNSQKNKFSGSTVYIDASKSEPFHIENKFGGVEVFFRNIDMGDPCGAVEVDVDNKFGGIEIHAPAEWFVENRINASLSGVEYRPNPTTYTRKLILTGNTKFGAVEVK